MKVGDLVKLRTHTVDSGPLGIVVATGSPDVLRDDEVFENRVAHVEWCSAHLNTVQLHASTRRRHRFAHLEVVA